jgi:hypothetical protein
MIAEGVMPNVNEGTVLFVRRSSSIPIQSPGAQSASIRMATMLARQKEGGGMCIEMNDIEYMCYLDI